MAFVAAFNKRSGNGSWYNFSLRNGQQETTLEVKEGGTTSSKEGKGLTENGTTAPLVCQSDLKDNSRGVPQTERSEKTRKEKNGEGQNQRLEKMGAMSKEWEAFLKSIAIGGESVVDNV